jgi:L-fuculose-phosphate aldolase
VLHADIRAEIAELGRRLEADGLLSSTAGNISARVAPDTIAITPSNIRYGAIEADDVVVSTLDGEIVDGRRRPSSELPFHTAVYRVRPDVAGVVHTHSPFATTLAVLGWTIPAVHYAIAVFGVDEVPLIPYATYGTDELAENVEAVCAGGANAALLANHGALALGRDLAAAATAAEILEFLATLYYRARSVGEPIVLSAEEIERVIERYRTHGQPRRSSVGSP